MNQNVNQTPNQPQENSQWPEILARVKAALKHNWLLKVISLVLAVALWGGIVSQDPTLTREKVFRDVDVEISGADSFLRNGYIVTSDLSAMLEGVDLYVDVPQQEYSSVRKSDYTLRVEVNRLKRQTGEQELTISYSPTNVKGTVKKITPSSVTVKVEEYVTRSYIPVNVETVGDAPDGYYVDTIVTDPNWIAVSGPRSEVERVQSACVVLDLGKLPPREGNVGLTLSCELLGEQQQVIFSDNLQITRDGSIRDAIGVNVRMYARKEVDILTAQLYSGKPAEGYEVTDVYVTPTRVTLAGSKSVLDTVELLQLPQLVNIAGRTSTVVSNVELNVPESVLWSSATQAVVTIVIRPKQATLRQVDLPINITGFKDGMVALVDQVTATVSITGPIDWVNSLTAGDLALSCDLIGLSEGVYEIPIKCDVVNRSIQDYTIEVEPSMIQVTLIQERGK